MVLNLFVDSAGVQVTEQIGFETQRDLFALTFEISISAFGRRIILPLPPRFHTLWPCSLFKGSKR
jgi:hypothetical protein